MDLQLKAIQVNLRMSQETTNFSASVYLDGRKIGTVGNDGWGDCDQVWWSDPEAGRRVEAHFASLPPIALDAGEGKEPFFAPRTFEEWTGGQVEIHILTKDVKRRMATKVLMAKGGEIYAFDLSPKKLDELNSRGKRNRDVLQENHPQSICLNGLSDAALLEAFIAQKICEPLVA